jgi:hypothetical protein
VNSLALLKTDTPSIDRMKLSGALAVHAMSSLHLVRHATEYAITGKRWDAALARHALRDCQDALSEIAALLPAEPQDDAKRSEPVAKLIREEP